IANFLLESDVHVIGVSRSTNSKLQTKAKELNMNYYDLSFDLTNVNEVKEMINQAKEILTQDNVTTIYIVNNAGILEPMDQAKEIDSEKLIKRYEMNALTSMMSRNRCLRLNGSSGKSMIVAKMTSGAANKAISGW